MSSDDHAGEHNPSSESTKQFLSVVVILWLLLELPLTFLGYGSDTDAWLVAKAADHIWTTGEYVKSRSTGFPLHELAVAPLVHFGGWQLANGFSVLFGALLILLLFRLERIEGFRNPRLVILSVAFAPMLIKGASSTLDYLPSLFALFLAYALALRERYSASGVLVGASCGLRPSNVIFIIPVLAYTYSRTRRWDQCLKALALSVVAGILAYSPVLMKYGFLQPYRADSISFTRRVFIWGYNVLELLGTMPSLYLSLALFPFLLSNRNFRDFRGLPPRTVFHLTNIGTWVLVFMAMPDEPEYLLPILPSVIILLDQVLATKQMLLLLVLILAGNVVRLDLVGGGSGTRRFEVAVKAGYLIEDIEERKFRLSTREAASDYQATRTTVLMFGDSWIPVQNPKWIHLPDLGMYRQKDGLLFLSQPIVISDRLRELASLGYRLVVWRGDQSVFVHSPDQEWRRYIEIVENLDEFFGVPISGKPRF